ncbi:uncharacterized protein LOC123372253 [Mauremys mutica]|uniref:uncharacterized protein LOC123372253 n=1 Tax=Mauremys mutica TaxID=74926 RepID=UPI001D16A939|nr:uncharacterized protein LOC123372253 [Mauremys mutica]
MDRENLKNYHPICLLSHIYKLFTKVITNQLSQSLDEQQPREQAGFQRNFSMIHHIFTFSQLLERAKEYKLPLCIAFVDYEKAFDSIKFNAILKALAEQGINAQYISFLKEANSGCTTDITLLETPLLIPIEKGVKQGDTISLKLFTACLEMVMNKINWMSGVNINGERLSHLRFTADIVLIAESTNQLHSMLRRLNKKSSQDILKGKINKTTRTNIFNSTVLPAMLYGSEMWALTKREEQRLSVAERVMEQAMLGIFLLDCIPNEMIRERSGVKDIVMESRYKKI